LFAFFKKRLSWQGGIDILVLNHIIGFFDPWAIPSTAPPGASPDNIQKLKQVIDVNALSYMYLATFALPHLRRSPIQADGYGGSVIVVSSMAGKMGMSHVAPYSASKHALNGFFDSLRIELLSEDVLPQNQCTPDFSPISITTVILSAFFSTSNALSNAKHRLTHVPQMSPALGAESLIAAGLSRTRQVLTQLIIHLDIIFIIHLDIIFIA
jgi:NAD(P)-dependent dehydrogenase (short-subunit alcohol dehydrogenase family)